ncbi:hypothetical protein IE4872_PD00586 (plasmid) [Rhizobium gallicum]|uniref:Uncharacterized protein n=1 Tax=Rhizobium gallicum TaxID=56730 RepID=A0A1L5NT83_9HYPH|nr:hypothetical protein IE4872_PD00586 [Rhizobium gallicum]
MGSCVDRSDHFSRRERPDWAALACPQSNTFVQEAGGNIGIENEPGVGTVVVPRLPVPWSKAEHRSTPSKPAGE